ncbi:hypothetical protein N7468_001448 [Penicillium chermesinum]|uniref:Uncharacterized protein n=1 Tax=Penicillium chermesinum TaxID=63820 RepID=A0A9W9PGT9_9EURO|nr:uncharacterized protein N7468_001448 [Penicillium chermesinum]KAJ5246465.1 hypothetical protein N7468_001448 [Penicillium chermesinum]
MRCVAAIRSDTDRIIDDKVPQLNIGISPGGWFAQLEVAGEVMSCTGEGLNPSGRWLLPILEATRYRSLASYKRVLLQTMDTT